MVRELARMPSCAFFVYTPLRRVSESTRLSEKRVVTWKTEYYDFVVRKHVRKCVQGAIKSVCAAICSFANSNALFISGDRCFRSDLPSTDCSESIDGMQTRGKAWSCESMKKLKYIKKRKSLTRSPDARTRLVSTLPRSVAKLFSPHLSSERKRFSSRVDTCGRTDSA